MTEASYFRLLTHDHYAAQNPSARPFADFRSCIRMDHRFLLLILCDPMSFCTSVMKPWLIALFAPLLSFVPLSKLSATETENLGLRLLLAAQPQAIDGTFNG